MGDRFGADSRRNSETGIGETGETGTVPKVPRVSPVPTVSPAPGLAKTSRNAYALLF